MDDIFSALEKSYRARCADPSGARAAWRGITAEFPPSLDARTADGLLPSTALALRSGDLGLALLWIVQAAVVRMMAADIARESEKYHPDLDAIAPSDIGALAHSEDRAAPVFLERVDGGIRLSGKKKYITGGLDADFVLVTARERGDDTIRSLVYVPRTLIGDGALADLSMDILRTVGHASLTFDDIILPETHLAVMDPGALRRHLKRWGIIERHLIMESYLAAMLYLARRIEGLPAKGDAGSDAIASLLDQQRRAVGDAVASARAGERIEASGAGFIAVAELFNRLGAACEGAGRSLPDDMALRHGDLTLFTRIRP